MADDILQGALERFAESQDATDFSREAYEEDTTFARLGEQWPDDIKKQRQEESRPVLTINKLPAFIRQVVNDARQNKPSIAIHPVDNGADEETAEVITGLVRSIERNCSADVAYDTAIDHAVSGGFGFFRIGIEFAHDQTFNLQAFIKRIPNALMVHWDPNSTEFDASDWEYGFISDWLTEDEFERQFPGKDKTSFKGADQDNVMHWRDGDKVRVAEYWLREHEDKDLLMLRSAQGVQVVREDQIPNLARRLIEGTGLDVGGASDRELIEVYLRTLELEEVKRRPVDVITIKRRVMSGSEVLEEDDWPGTLIPICPVWGDEVIIDGRRHFRSMIRDARDPQAMFNFWRSAETESVALQPRTPFIAQEGFLPDSSKEAQKWLTANTRSHAYLTYNSQMNKPERQPFAGVPAGALQQSLNASDDMKAVMGTFDAALGARSNETSGVAIRQRQRESDVGSFHYIDNLSRAIRYAGQVLVEIIPAVYSVQETIRILGEDQAESVINLTQEAGGGEVENGKRDLYNLTVGKYDVTVAAGPSFTTQREETREFLIEIMRNIPGSAAFVGDLLADVMDFQGADRLAARMKFLLPPEVRQAEDAEGLDDLSDEAKARVQQAQQVVTQLQQQLAEATKAAEETQSKGQADLLEAQTDAKAKVAQFQLDLAEAQASTSLKSRELDIKAAEVALKQAESEARRVEAELAAVQAAAEAEVQAQTEGHMQQAADAMAVLAQSLAPQDNGDRHAELLAAITAPKKVSLDRDRTGKLTGGTTTTVQ